MKTLLTTIWFELDHLLRKRAVWFLTAAYAGIAFILCLSDALRQSYFSMMDSVPVMLNSFVLPIVLTAMLILTLSPAFAGDREQQIEQIPAACRLGRSGRSLAKWLGAFAFSLVILLLLEAVTWGLCLCFGLADLHAFLRHAGAEAVMEPVWTAGQHMAFSTVSLLMGCLLLALLVLFVSCCVKSALAAVSLSFILVLLAFIINRFSFPSWMQAYNIWVFFRPYYLFTTELLSASPWIDLLLLSLAFLPPSLLAVRQILRKGV